MMSEIDQENDNLLENTVFSEENNYFDSKSPILPFIDWIKRHELLSFFFSIPIVFGALYGWEVLFHNPFCNFLFRCGCTWEWDGGWDDCNVHNQHLPHSEHCPWCAAKQNVVFLTSPWVVISVSILFYVAVFFALRKARYFHRPVGLILLAATPFASWVLYDLVLGIFFFLFTSYKWFIF